jgi:FkbM family methyltransferase
MDLERAFARAMTCARGPWWRRLLHKPAKTLIYEAALRLPRGVPFARPVSARTFFGEEMRVVLPEESACQLWYYGFIEEDVTAFLLTYVREGMTVIDVGAHSGYFTLLASALVQPSGWVHAFEPARRTCARLRHNTRRHRNVTVQQQALWSSRTTRPFHEYGERYSTLNSVSNHRLIQEIGRVRQRSYDVECLSLLMLTDFASYQAPRSRGGHRRRDCDSGPHPRPRVLCSGVGRATRGAHTSRRRCG